MVSFSLLPLLSHRSQPSRPWFGDTMDLPRHGRCDNLKPAKRFASLPQIWIDQLSAAVQCSQSLRAASPGSAVTGCDGAGAAPGPAEIAAGARGRVALGLDRLDLKLHL
eukprot:765456-Hanusia_phi.AAC.5